MPSSKKITKEEAMQDLAKRSHAITPNKAETMMKKYKSFKTKIASAKKTEAAVPKNTPDFPLSITYNKKAITKLLKSSDCAGLRIYPAINDANSLTLVLVGIDAAGNDIEDVEIAAKGAAMAKPGGGTVDEGQTNPPFPG